MSKIDPVLEKLTEMSERMARVETKVDFLSEDMKEVKAQDLIQNKLIDEHIAGVNSLKQLIQIESAKFEVYKTETDARLKILEFPFKFIQTNKKALVWIGGICSALAGIAKFAGLF